MIKKIELVRIKCAALDEAQNLDARRIEDRLSKKVLTLGNVGTVRLIEIENLDPDKDLGKIRGLGHKKVMVPSWAVPSDKKAIALLNAYFIRKYVALIYDVELQDHKTIRRAVWLRNLKGGAVDRTHWEFSFNGYSENVIRNLEKCAQLLSLPDNLKTINLIDPDLVVKGKLPDLNTIFQSGVRRTQKNNLLEYIPSRDLD